MITNDVRDRPINSECKFGGYAISALPYVKVNVNHCHAYGDQIR